MNRPVLEVADLVRAAGDGFIERSRRWIRCKHVKVLRAIARCRTAALGGHFDECTDCGHRTNHLLQQLSRPALSKMSDRCPRPLDRSTSQGTASDSRGSPGPSSATRIPRLQQRVIDLSDLFPLAASTIPFDTQSQCPLQDVLLSFMTALPPPPIRNRAHLGSQ
jgi:hypothetical protein